MASELAVAGIQSGILVTSMVRRDTDEKVWNVSTLSFDVYSDIDANAGLYFVDLTEQGSSGYYTGDFPTGITEAGIYNVVYYSQEGSEDYIYEASASVSWTGTEVDDGGSEATPPGIDWILLSEYKTYKGISATDTDSQLSAFITAASAMCNSYLKRTIKAAPVVRVYRNQLATCLNLGEYPVNSITSVVLDYYGDARSVDGSEFYTNDAGTLRFKQRSQYRQSLQSDAIKVIFSAGYTTVPSDLKAAIFLVVDKLSYMADDEQVVVGKSVKDVSIKYSNPLLADASDPIMGNARVILDAHKALILV